MADKDVALRKALEREINKLDRQLIAVEATREMIKLIESNIQKSK